MTHARSGCRDVIEEPSFYTLVVTAVAGTAFGDAAQGSLAKEGGRTVGSRHLGQPFDDPRYF